MDECASRSFVSIHDTNIVLGVFGCLKGHQRGSTYSFGGQGR